tara:strand:- start:24 stop:476 length:453 start_codon:yes stop_codon:yes gene_type:complete
LTELELLRLNGSYFEIIKNPISKNLEDFFWPGNRINHSKLHVGDTVHYQLQFIENKSLVIKSLHNNKLCQEDTLIGTIEQQYLYLQQRKKWDHSEGYVLFSTETQQNRIGLKSNGDLHIDNWNRWVLKLIYIPIIIEKEHYQHTVYKKHE